MAKKTTKAAKAASENTKPEQEQPHKFAAGGNIKLKNGKRVKVAMVKRIKNEKSPVYFIENTKGFSPKYSWVKRHGLDPNKKYSFVSERSISE